MFFFAEVKVDLIHSEAAEKEQSGWGSPGRCTFSKTRRPKKQELSARLIFSHGVFDTQTVEDSASTCFSFIKRFCFLKTWLQRHGLGQVKVLQPGENPPTGSRSVAKRKITLMHKQRRKDRGRGSEVETREEHDRWKERCSVASTEDSGSVSPTSPRMHKKLFGR